MSPCAKKSVCVRACLFYDFDWLKVNTYKTSAQKQKQKTFLGMTD